MAEAVKVIQGFIGEDVISKNQRLNLKRLVLSKSKTRPNRYKSIQEIIRRTEIQKGTQR